MKNFHISDVLSVTTGRLVSNRHIDGVYEILNYMTGDNLMTHQLPRAMRDCDSCFRAQYPQLMADSPEMMERIEQLANMVKPVPPDVLADWVDRIQAHFDLPDMLPLEPMSSGTYRTIDPLEELVGMVGPEKVIVVKVDRKSDEEHRR